MIEGCLLEFDLLGLIDVYKFTLPSTGTSTTNDEESKGFSFGRGPEKDVASTQNWFPAAGDQLENEVDEPNQQGLIKPRNNGRKLAIDLLCAILSVVALRLC